MLNNGLQMYSIYSIVSGRSFTELVVRVSERGVHFSLLNVLGLIYYNINEVIPANFKKKIYLDVTVLIVVHNFLKH